MNINHRTFAMVFYLQQAKKFSHRIMNKKALLAFAIAVFIPLISYFWVKAASDNATIMPSHYLPDTVINRVEKGKMINDTVWHKVANFHLINQLGDTVSLY